MFNNIRQVLIGIVESNNAFIVGKKGLVFIRTNDSLPITEKVKRECSKAVSK